MSKKSLVGLVGSKRFNSWFQSIRIKLKVGQAGSISAMYKVICETNKVGFSCIENRMRSYSNVIDKKKLELSPESLRLHCKILYYTELT